MTRGILEQNTHAVRRKALRRFNEAVRKGLNGAFSAQMVLAGSGMDDNILAPR